MNARLALMLAAAAMIVTLAGGLYWKGRHDGVAQERPKVEAALNQAKVAGLEAEGARASAQRVDAVVHQRDAAKAVVVQLTSKALKSEDANAPLDPARAARLRDADLQLCDDDPALAGCPAAGNAG